jgi:hypothetical protein
MTQKVIGRPTVMTKATVLKLETALRDGFSIEMACYVSGVSRSAYYAQLERSPDFAHNMVLSKQWVVERAKQVVTQAVAKGDLKASQWLLERRCRAEYAVNPPPQPELEPKANLFGDGDNTKLINLVADTLATLGIEPESSEPAIAKA